MEPHVLLETRRLRLRRIEQRDLADLCALDRDPEVMRYIGGVQDGDPETTRATIERIRAVYEELPGQGAFAVERKDEGRFLGWACLKPLDGGPKTEVGYRLARQAWGFGIATEAARALVAHGFEALGLDRILGVTHEGNLASQRVLEKVGLTPRGPGRYYGFDVLVFGIERGAWRADEAS